MNPGNQTQEIISFSDQQNLQTLPAEHSMTMDQTKKQSKSSLNKAGSSKKQQILLSHPNCGKVRHQPISVWDQIQVHDAALYQQEMEEKRKQKRLEQMQMREFLQHQMVGNSNNQMQEKRHTFETEQKLVNQAVRKVQIREQARDMWVKQQMKNSNYLNHLNSLYKSQADLEKEESPDFKQDYHPDKGLNIILAGIQDKQRRHQEMVRLNAQQNNLLITSQNTMKASQKQLEELESMKAIQN